MTSGSFALLRCFSSSRKATLCPTFLLALKVNQPDADFTWLLKVYSAGLLSMYIFCFIELLGKLLLIDKLKPRIQMSTTGPDGHLVSCQSPFTASLNVTLKHASQIYLCFSLLNVKFGRNKVCDFRRN